ncbi:hypothetical protein NPIL_64571 [Nephila pilipes]|uniref:Uncharacterized protein n=1 Tax=Nephila pilipes TaxID=299642 RepID=A0A8X6NB44_NEPPI|nr:hypothetical protein NPIL_64571 [Nephila pilipes]
MEVMYESIDTPFTTCSSISEVDVDPFKSENSFIPPQTGISNPGFKRHIYRTLQSTDEISVTFPLTLPPGQRPFCSDLSSDFRPVFSKPNSNPRVAFILLLTFCREA